jgi:hypothetical protein
VKLLRAVDLMRLLKVCLTIACNGAVVFQKAAV